MIRPGNTRSGWKQQSKTPYDRERGAVEDHADVVEEISTREGGVDARKALKVKSAGGEFVSSFTGQPNPRPRVGDRGLQN